MYAPDSAAAGPVYKIARAAWHLRDLRRECRTFSDDHFRSHHRDNAETGNREWWASCDTTALDPLSAILGDAVHNLRSALDHVYWRLVEANKQTPGEQTSFPIRKSADAYRNDRARIEGEIGGPAMTVMDSLKPYREGNEAFWRTHRLDIVDKHRLLVPVVSSYQGSRSHVPMADFTKPTATEPFTLGTQHIIHRSEPIPIAAEEVLVFTTPLDDVFVENVQLQFDLRIHEPAEIGDDLSIISELPEIGGEIAGAVEAFAALLP